MTIARLDEVIKSLDGLSQSELNTAVEIKKILKDQKNERIKPILKAVEDLQEHEICAVDEIKKILQVQDEARIKLILHAAVSGHISTIRYLLDKQIVDANTVFSWSHRPRCFRTLLTEAVDHAIATSNNDMVNMLLNEYKLTPETLNFCSHNMESSIICYYGNALQKAISANRIDLIKLLLEKGASSDVNLKQMGGEYPQTLITYTAKLRHISIEDKKQIIELLLKFKKEKCTENEETAIEYIRKGVNLSEDELKALYAVKQLIREKGSKEKIELAALSAAEKGDVVVLKYLFDQQILQPNTILYNEKVLPETLLMASLRWNGIPNPVATMLLEGEYKKLELADLNFSDPETGNALEKAIGARNVEVVRTLIRREVTPVDRKGELITQVMNEKCAVQWGGRDTPMEVAQRQITEMLTPYINRYQAKKAAARRVAAPATSDEQSPGVCETLTNWFFCCRRQKAAMKDAATNTESHEVKEVKKLA